MTGPFCTYQVEGEAAGKEVMTSRAAWRRAISKYKQVVTHFFAYKTEQWHGGFLYVTLDVSDFHGVFEFAKFRGCIHYHSMCSSASPFDVECDEALSDLCMQMNEVAKEFEAGAITAAEFSAAKETNCATTAARMNLLFELHLGASASHPGRAPGDWVAPGGGPGSGHRETTSGMSSKSDVRDTEELSGFKFESEARLHQRLVNIMNVAFTHHCSDYCWKYRHMEVPYDIAIHGTSGALGTDVVRINKKKVKADTQKGRSRGRGRASSNAPQQGKGRGRGSGAVGNGEPGTAVVRVWECRMGFGHKLKAPRHGDWCHGRDALRVAEFKFDGNGQPSFSPVRNHPRVLHEPSHVYYWGANVDLQRLLSNSATHRKFMDANDPSDAYEELARHIDSICGMRGLEEGIGAMIIEDYIVGYKTKGKKASKEWSELLRGIEDGLAADKGNTPLRSVVGKQMHAIAKSRDRSKDEASFMLSGGKLTYSTVKVQCCSVTSVALDDIGCKVGDPSAWTFQSLRKR